jgi:hypothetical protein
MLFLSVENTKGVSPPRAECLTGRPTHQGSAPGLGWVGPDLVSAPGIAMVRPWATPSSTSSIIPNVTPNSTHVGPRGVELAKYLKSLTGPPSTGRPAELNLGELGAQLDTLPAAEGLDNQTRQCWTGLDNRAQQCYCSCKATGSRIRTPEQLRTLATDGSTGSSPPLRPRVTNG